MNNWDDLRFLVALSKTGTMTAAARSLGTNTATVSRRIERLSDTLGMPAFVKTSDGWRPSEAVSSLISLAQSFDGELQAALNTHGADPEAPGRGETARARAVSVDGHCVRGAWERTMKGRN